MKNKALPWEHGSEFHWMDGSAQDNEDGGHPWGRTAVFLGSGRDALRSIIKIGHAINGWRKILLPSFLCLEIAESIIKDGFDIEIYPDDPRLPIAAPPPKSDQAVFIVNTFGLREKWQRPPECGGGVIEDHTHDPWSQWAHESRADYCFASLRKTLPIPDGAVAWSPNGGALPPVPELSSIHQQAALRKLGAMILKALYLQGRAIPKQTFRGLVTAGERDISAGEISAIEPISTAIIDGMPCLSWRKRRRANFLHLSRALADLAGVSVLHPRDSMMCPFSVILVCGDGNMRDTLKARLIERDVYPAVLWPLKKLSVAIPEDSIALSERMLSLHCDGRYSIRDMDRVAALISESLP